MIQKKQVYVRLSLEIVAMPLTLEQKSTQYNRNSSPQNVSVLSKRYLWGHNVTGEAHTGQINRTVLNKPSVETGPQAGFTRVRISHNTP